MIIALKRDKIVGFLQLILKNTPENNNILIIDLIAVDSSFRKCGIAKSMINYAETNLKELKKIRVGTQIVNIPSMRLYESIGFRICETNYILHFFNIRLQHFVF